MYIYRYVCEKLTNPIYVFNNTIFDCACCNAIGKTQYSIILAVRQGPKSQRGARWMVDSMGGGRRDDAGPAELLYQRILTLCDFLFLYGRVGGDIYRFSQLIDSVMTPHTQNV